jgi:hypothetical protein
VGPIGQWLRERRKRWDAKGVFGPEAKMGWRPARLYELKRKKKERLASGLDKR